MAQQPVFPPWDRSVATSLSLLSSVVLSAFRTRRQVGLENGLAAARRRRTGQKTQPGGNRRAYTGPPCQGSCNMGASVSISLFIPPPPLSSSTTFKDSGTCGRARGGRVDDVTSISVEWVNCDSSYSAEACGFDYELRITSSTVFATRPSSFNYGNVPCHPRDAETFQIRLRRVSHSSLLFQISIAFYERHLPLKDHVHE
ncbi:hypothetical protein JOL62DRAFT_560606 [Phyllosticta paracitricarpa]|uniref:Uncharacterized protein n=1 Tax=Phyllosticta paracitricarpa TaxID=2016321 RepID=A0ABR1MSN7_9PEZI